MKGYRLEARGAGAYTIWKGNKRAGMVTVNDGDVILSVHLPRAVARWAEHEAKKLQVYRDKTGQDEHTED